MSTLVWIRNDLRVEDNPALYEAALKGAVLPLYIWDPNEERKLGGASKAWLHYSLKKLEISLGGLVLRTGDIEKELLKFVKQTGVERVYWNRRYTPEGILLDTRIKKKLKELGIEVETFPGNVLFEPGVVANKQGKPYQAFASFWEACQESAEPDKPLAKPHRIEYIGGISSLKLRDLDLLSEKEWDMSTWRPGEESANKKAKSFLKGHVEEYEELNDFPAEMGTSRLSPHLHFGEISVRSLWFKPCNEGEKCWLSKIGWREFAIHLLYHYPMSTEKPFKKKFEKFEWRSSEEDLKAWQQGLTGYPIVDAGMRELQQTGWMQNSVRMIVGSFLVKDLLISWKEGEKWFWNTLVDADLASNILGWQWISGCGADAMPYSSVLDPTTQGEKIDPEGDYIRKWVRELKHVPKKYIHKPWDYSGDLRYPSPIVEHNVARALERFSEIK